MRDPPPPCRSSPSIGARLRRVRTGSMRRDAWSANAGAPLGIQQVKDGAFASALCHHSRRLGRRSGTTGRLRHDRQPPGLARGAVLRLPRSVRPAGGEFDALRRRIAGNCARSGLPRRRGCFPTSCVARRRRSSAPQPAWTAPRRRPHSSCLPGTHSKWALVTGNVLDRFATFMTGEVYAVLKAHSILGRMMMEAVGCAGGHFGGLPAWCRARTGSRGRGACCTISSAPARLALISGSLDLPRRPIICPAF